MRQLVIVPLLCLVLTVEIFAQNPYIQYSTSCSYSFGGQGSLGQGLFPPTQNAVYEVELICSVFGIPPIPIFQGGPTVQNAMATTVQGNPIIVYSSNFLNYLASRSRWAAICVLAHEVGHHVHFSTDMYAPFEHPWTRELKADYLAGLALARLGATLEQTLSVQFIIPDWYGSSSHPDAFKRLAALELGWRNGV